MIRGNNKQKKLLSAFTDKIEKKNHFIDFLIRTHTHTHICKMAEKFLTIVRILSFLIYLFSIYWQSIVQPPFLSPERKLFGPLIYLTYWDLVNIVV